jgi:Zn-finger nucleic acid-binding protein/RNA polymerase subunit RPABC4/transcription elongation factor Spt4
MAADASSLHCPNCGAAVEPEAGRCPYCKARLATVSCPSCFALMFDGAKFCPGCGAARARTVAPVAATLSCPGCKGTMAQLRVGTTELFECAACDGLWVDAATFERLCTNADDQAAVLHQFSTPGAEKTAPVRYRTCARCAQMMNRVNFGRLSGVVVDACRGHGTYLDAGELHRIVAFIQSGGLERARAAQIEELKERERRAVEAEQRAARERGRSDIHGGSVSWSFLIGG